MKTVIPTLSLATALAISSVSVQAKTVCMQYSYDGDGETCKNIDVGDTYDFYDKPGGGSHNGGKDTASCRIGDGGELIAINHDSQSPNAEVKTNNNPRIGSCTSATYNATHGVSYTVKCCLESN